MANEAHAVGADATEVGMDQVNIWMRAQPWYQQQMQQWGQDPGHPHLAKSQQQQILKLAQANGVAVDEGNHEIDAGGNFDKKGHALRNTLIVAGIVGASIATMGAAGMFAGAAGAGGAGAAGGTVGGTLAGTTTLGSSVLGGSGLAAGGVAGGSGLAAAGGTAGILAGGAIPAESALAASAGGGGSIASSLLGAGEKYATKKGLSTASDLLRGGGQAVGDATNAAANNRMSADEVAMRGQNNYETQLLNRAQVEAQERKDALKDLYRQSYAANRKPGPYNTAGLTPYSDSYKAGLSAIEQQGLARLQKPAAYGMDTAPTLTQFRPTPAGKAERIGNYASPALTIGGMALDYFKNR